MSIIQRHRPVGAAPGHSSGPSLFAQAARCYDGYEDQETGVRVLRIRPPGEVGRILETPYQQTRCFLAGGRLVLLRCKGGDLPRTRFLLDLATGELREPFPVGMGVLDLDDHSACALLVGQGRSVVHDLTTGQDLATISDDGWQWAHGCLLADGRRAVVSHYLGKPYDEPCRTRFHLLSPGEAPSLLFEREGIFGNHIQACPTDANLFSYNAWPTPGRDVPGVTSIAAVDGSQNYLIPIAEGAPQPGDFWGVRDHYVWTPDGSRIVSYLNVNPVDHSIPFNHFEFEWWISALDWRTGEDFCAKYPPGRWGGHMHMTPDSRHIVCGGGPGFDKLFVVNIEKLRHGWHERVICSYPTTNAAGGMANFYPYPFVLPDSSGILFNAGWPGAEHGIYLAEWPKDL
jgi:hypothetical protein